MSTGSIDQSHPQHSTSALGKITIFHRCKPIVMCDSALVLICYLQSKRRERLHPDSYYVASQGTNRSFPGSTGHLLLQIKG